jgi:BTB/POZ domain
LTNREIEKIKQARMAGNQQRNRPEHQQQQQDNNEGERPAQRQRTEEEQQAAVVEPVVMFVEESNETEALFADWRINVFYSKDDNITKVERSFSVHKVVLATKSEYFKRRLQGNYQEHSQQTSSVELPQWVVSNFEVVLKSLYLNNFLQLERNTVSATELAVLLYASQYFQVPFLEIGCKKAITTLHFQAGEYVFVATQLQLEFVPESLIEKALTETFDILNLLRAEQILREPDADKDTSMALNKREKRYIAAFLEHLGHVSLERVNKLRFPPRFSVALFQLAMMREKVYVSGSVFQDLNGTYQFDDKRGYYVRAHSNGRAVLMSFNRDSTPNRWEIRGSFHVHYSSSSNEYGHSFPPTSDWVNQMGGNDVIKVNF